MIKNLVFEGGGVKGIAYGGALVALKELDILQGIERVAGTSAGAITAVLLAVGYSDEEISDIVAKTDFNDFSDDSFGVIRDFNRFIKDFGWHKGDMFTEWIGELIKAKTGMADTTFAELNMFDFSKDLYLTATNVSKQRVEIFSAETTPGIEIKLAARMSMSIPYFFQCVRMGDDDDVYVDGGVTRNYPIKIFDDICEADETIGFRVDSKDEISCEKIWGNPAAKTENIFDFSISLVSLLQSQANKKHLSKVDFDRTIFIDSLNVSAVDFDVSEESISKLIESGYKSTKEYFESN